MNAGQCDEGRRRRKSGSTLKLVCTSCSLAPPKKNVVLKRGEEEKKTFTCVFNGRPAPLRAQYRSGLRTQRTCLYYSFLCWDLFIYLYN